MIFGIPWYAIVAIIAVAAPFIFAYKEKELKNEEKRITHSKELNEMRKIVHNLKGRIEKLEAIVTAEKDKSMNSALHEIEIDEETERDSGRTSPKTKIH